MHVAKMFLFTKSKVTEQIHCTHQFLKFTRIFICKYKIVSLTRIEITEKFNRKNIQQNIQLAKWENAIRNEVRKEWKKKTHTNQTHKSQFCAICHLLRWKLIFHRIKRQKPILNWNFFSCFISAFLHQWHSNHNETLCTLHMQ